MFVAFLLLALLCNLSSTFAKDNCPKVVQCINKAIKLGEKCAKDLPAAFEKDTEVVMEDEKCMKSFEDMHMRELKEEVNRGKAVVKCVGKVDDRFICPKMSARRRMSRKRRQKRAGRTGSMDKHWDDKEYDDWDWEYMPDSCKKAEEKEMECMEMAFEGRECRKFEFCELCYDRSDLARAAIDAEIKLFRETKDCDFDDYGDDMTKRRKKRFVKRR